MNKPISTRKPIQAGDYGKVTTLDKDNGKKTENKNTDGRKVMALWSR